MGCFLACFGFKKKNKNRKPRKKCFSIEQNHGSYIPLDSDVSFMSEEKNLTSDSESKKNGAEPSRSKIKKKVSFNLNVKAYEPIRNEEDISPYLSEGEEETEWEINPQTKKINSLTNDKEGSKLSSIQPYPQNYRYQNCRESFDEEEEDEFKLDENDLDLDDFEDSDADNEDSYADGSEDEILNQEEELLQWKTDHEVTADQINEERNTCRNARDKSWRAISVLNPVENISQWKALKAKTMPMKREKENIAMDQQPSNGKCDSDASGLQKMRNLCVSQSSGRSIEVDASLSNWLSSSVMEHRKKTLHDEST